MGKATTQRLALVFFGFLVAIGLLELLLRVGLFRDQLVWIPPDALEYDQELEAVQFARAARSPHKFNDRVREKEKASGTYRIAVLGDSFVFGDGLREQDRWSVKFEKLTRDYNDRVEVLHWGRNGWSTLPQYLFARQYAEQYGIDLIVVSFCVNDLDRGQTKRVDLHWPAGPEWLGYSYQFLQGVLGRAIEMVFNEVGYANWVERLYSEENRRRYLKLLQNFRELSNDTGIPVFFVLLPSNNNPYFREKFEIVAGLLEKVGFEHRNLYPVIEREFGDDLPITLRANRADGHPGPLMTEVFARETFTAVRELYLESPDVRSDQPLQ